MNTFIYKRNNMHCNHIVKLENFQTVKNRNCWYIFVTKGYDPKNFSFVKQKLDLTKMDM